jgi:TetR/AcrR family transcriptional regulator
MVKTKETDNQTRDRIFKAASDIFEEKGYDGARMQEIADRAGINKALLHYYFRTKELLFAAVFRVLLRKMFEKIFSIFMEDISFKDKIRKFFDQHIEILIKNPRLPIFLLNEISHNPGLVEGIHGTLPLDQLRSTVFQMHAKEMKGYGIKKDDMPQLIMTIVSLSVFPFAARDVIRMMIPEVADNKKFIAFMRERKEFAAEFVITALKNRKK